MSETQAAIGYGTLLQYSNGASPPQWTTLAEVTNITGPGMSRELPDATHMESPGGWREFLGGLKDAGEITVECNHLPHHASQDASTGVLALFASGARTAWRIVFPVSPEVIWEMDAVVSAFEPSFPVEDKMGLSVTLKVSGQPSFLENP
jgi:predicted secreted protein